VREVWNTDGFDLLMAATRIGGKGDLTHDSVTGRHVYARVGMWAYQVRDSRSIGTGVSSPVCQAR